MAIIGNLFKVNEKYRVIVISALIALVLTVAAVICEFTVSPQQLSTSFGLSVMVIVLYQVLFFFAAVTLTKVLSLILKLNFHPGLKLLIILLGLILIRQLSIVWHFPTMLYSTIFFGPQGYLSGLYAESVGVLLIDSCLFLLISLFVLNYWSNYRGSLTSKHPKLRVPVLASELFLALVVFTFFPVLLDSLSKQSTIELNPCQLMQFNGSSALIVFILLAVSLSVSLILKRALHAISRTFREKKIWICLIVASVVTVYNLLFILLPTPFEGVPIWVWLLFIDLYVFVTIIWSDFERMDYRFFAVISKILIITSFISLFIGYYVQEHNEVVVEQLVSELVVSSPDSLCRCDNCSGGINDASGYSELFNNVYGNTTLPMTYAWVVKSQNHLNRQVLENYPYETTHMSIAYYLNGLLIDQYGENDYKINADEYLLQLEKDKDRFYNAGHYHRLFPIGKSGLIVVSYPEKTRYNWIAAASFYFITFLFFYGITFFLSRLFIRGRQPLSLYANFLWTQLAILLFVGLCLCILSVRYTVQRWDNDLKCMAKVKIGKAQMELARNCGQMDFVRQNISSEKMNAILQELSEQYQLMLSVYDLNGQLLYASPTSILPEFKWMSPFAHIALMRGNTYWYEKDHTDRIDILRVYKMVLDEHGVCTGYIVGSDLRNKFSKEEKVSYLITRHLYFFAWLILASILFSFLFYAIIHGVMGKLGTAIRNRNKPYSPIRLDWEVNEEIGILVKEHNQMVDEIRANAIKMAKSERETAWREMALEISHEVKNPLTPMRLKMQMLQKMWLRGSSDIGSRISDAADEVIRQTDALSEVADIFSEFASSQAGVNKQEDMRVLLSELSSELPSFIAAHYDFRIDAYPHYYALVDRNLFKKMIINLVKNAYHNRQEHGKLDVTITINDDSDPSFWLLSFGSNDKGLDYTDVDSVFSVKFSHGNRGHSLCLPIVKNIVTSFNGEITFATVRGSGTEFFIKIPKL